MNIYVTYTYTHVNILQRHPHILQVDLCHISISIIIHMHRYIYTSIYMHKYI